MPVLFVKVFFTLQRCVGALDLLKAKSGGTEWEESVTERDRKIDLEKEIGDGQRDRDGDRK